MKSPIKKFKKLSPYLRDVYLAYLVEGARRTKKEGYPIIESWMIPDEVPENIIQWDKRSEIKDKKSFAISFYCNDERTNAFQSNPKKYLEIISQYKCMIGPDFSPYDNMPNVVQKSQIFDSLAITHYFGRQGIKVIPNVRLGTSCTYDSLEAYPHEKLISIGTNGFMHELANRKIFSEQVSLITNTLSPIGIIVYGPALPCIFREAEKKGIPIYQFDSYIQKKYRMRKGVTL